MHTTYTTPGRDEAIDAMFFDDDDTLMDEYEERRAIALEGTYKAAHEYGCIRIEANGLTWYLHNSSRHAGLQMTSWDERGPIGHDDITGPADLEMLPDEWQISA